MIGLIIQLLESSLVLNVILRQVVSVFWSSFSRPIQSLCVGMKCSEVNYRIQERGFLLLHTVLLSIPWLS